jgi:SAM-dependent methyltransferase
LWEAKKLFPLVTFFAENFTRFSDKFGVVISKAVLEHQNKDEVIPFLEKISGVLAPGGKVIIDVPNMDWLFAGHERYMDFTHEVGFTKESLGQVMRQVFKDVKVYPVDVIKPSLRTKVSRWFLDKLLRGADNEGAGNPIWCRVIIGVGMK